MNRVIKSIGLLLALATSAAAQSTNVIVNGWLKNALMGNNQWVSNVQMNGSAIVDGTVNSNRLGTTLAQLFHNDAHLLEKLNPTNIIGIVPVANLPVLPRTLLPALLNDFCASSNGLFILQLNATSIITGTLPPQVLGTALSNLNIANGGALTGLNASALFSGTIPSARLGTALSNLSLDNALNLTNLNAGSMRIGTTLPLYSLGTVLSNLAIINGAALTNLNASELRSGTIPLYSLDTVLSNLAILNGGSLTNLQGNQVRNLLTNVSATFGLGVDCLVPLPAGYTRMVGSPWLENGTGYIVKAEFASPAGTTVSLAYPNGIVGLTVWATFSSCP